MEVERWKEEREVEREKTYIEGRREKSDRKMRIKEEINCDRA